MLKNGPGYTWVLGYTQELGYKGILGLKVELGYTDILGDKHVIQVFGSVINFACKCHNCKCRQLGFRGELGYTCELGFTGELGYTVVIRFKVVLCYAGVSVCTGVIPCCHMKIFWCLLLYTLLNCPIRVCLPKIGSGCGGEMVDVDWVRAAHSLWSVDVHTVSKPSSPWSDTPALFSTQDECGQILGMNHVIVWFFF